MTHVETPPPSADPGASADAGRTRILTAAVQAFGAKGFHGTTTRDIATAAGLSPAAIYVHHRSKEDLLHLVCLAGHRELLTLVEAALARASTPADRLAALVRVWTEQHARQQATARVVNDELGVLSAEHRAEIDPLRRRLEQVARGVIEEGVAAGDFEVTDVHLVTRAVLSLGQDVAHWYRPDGRWSVEHLAERYVELALRMVGHRSTGRP